MAYKSSLFRGPLEVVGFAAFLVSGAAYLLRSVGAGTIAQAVTGETKSKMPVLHQ